MKTILYFLLVAGLILGASLIPNIGVTLGNGFLSALVFSIVLTVVNVFLGGILKIVGLPLNIITFGLFSIVVTFAMIYLTDYIYEGIEIKSFFDGGILAYIIIALIPGIVGIFVKPFFK